jgi:hypothetical protein
MPIVVSLFNAHFVPTPPYPAGFFFVSLAGMAKIIPFPDATFVFERPSVLQQKLQRALQQQQVDDQQQIDDQQIEDVPNTLENVVAALQLVVLRLIEARAEKAKLFITYDTDVEGGFINLGFDADELLSIMQKAVAADGEAADDPEGAA